MKASASCAASAKKLVRRIAWISEFCPQETGAFVQLDVLERGQDEHTRAFSGWLFKENPSLNVVEHPVYDVWVKDCAMSFPGEE